MRANDPTPATFVTLSSDTLVGDVVITDSPTPLIRHAMSFGCRVVEGKDMHAGQIDAIMAFFTCNDVVARPIAEHSGTTVSCPLSSDS
jgi:shikimate dehydrogenase